MLRVVLVTDYLLQITDHRFLRPDDGAKLNPGERFVVYTMEALTLSIPPEGGTPAKRLRLRRILEASS